MIYEVTNKGLFMKDYRLRDQIVGAGISIMNNIAEGFGSQSNIEFIRFLRYSRRSTSEVQNCLYIAFDQEYIKQETLERFYNQVDKVRKIIDGFIRYLKKNKIRHNEQNEHNGLNGLNG